MTQTTESNGSLASDIAEADRLSRHHHKLRSLIHIFDANRQHPVLTFPGMPAWIDPRENTQQENNGQTDVEVTDIPDSVIDHEWPSIMDSPACLSRYCLFGSEEDLNSYVDIISKFINPTNLDRKLTHVRDFSSGYCSDCGSGCLSLLPAFYGGR